MSTKFWKANKATSAEIKQIYTDLETYYKVRTNLARRLGFSSATVATYGNSWLGQRVVGFYVKRNGEDPDPKMYKRSKACDERGLYCWIPKRVPKQRDVNAVLDEWFDKNKRLEEVLGIKFLINLEMHSIGVHIRKGTAYLETYAKQGTPEGCREITNMTFNKAKAMKS